MPCWRTDELGFDLESLEEVNGNGRVQPEIRRVQRGGNSGTFCDYSTPCMWLVSDCNLLKPLHVSLFPEMLSTAW
jgi:hypothetical protein